MDSDKVYAKKIQDINKMKLIGELYDQGKKINGKINIIGEIQYEPKVSLFLGGAIKKKYLTLKDVISYSMIKSAQL